VKADTGDATLDAVLDAAQRARTAADACLRKDGLSVPRYKLLRSLEAGSLSMREVSDALGISPRTVTDLIDGLEERGLVSRTPHASDRRVTLLTLTEDGRAALVQGRRRIREVTARSVQGLSAEDRRTLIELLAQVHTAPAAAEREPAGVRTGP
jgi:DNA-binding MarR family transcriptional regulator